MPRVADIPRPKMPEDGPELVQLAMKANYGAANGYWNSARAELTKMADAILKGQSPHMRGRYSIADKYADRPKFQHKPYRTRAMYASGKSGRRALGGHL